MQKLESFLILVNNLSDVYIFTVVTMFSVAAVTLYCTRVMNRNLKMTQGSNSESQKTRKKAKNSDSEEEDDDAGLVDDRSHHESSSDNEDTGRDYVREIKSAKIKQLEETLTDEQIEEERRIESHQLAAIYELLKKQEEEYNTSSIDEIEFKKQLSLYR